MVINKTFFIFTSILFLFIFGPVIYFDSIVLNFPRFTLFVLLTILLITIFVKKSYVIKFKNETLLLFASLCLIILYSLVNYIYINDNYMLKVAVNLTFYWIATISLLNIFSKKEYIYDSIFDIIFLITFINSILIILMGTIDVVQQFVQQFQKQTPLLELAGHYRMMALNGDAGASLSLLTFFGAITYFYSYRFGKLKSLFMFLVIVTSMIYIGRTGILFFILYMFALYQVFIFKKLNILGTFLGNIILIFCFISTLEFLTYIFYNIDIHPSVWTTIEPFVEMYTLESGMPRVIEFIIENFLFLPKSDFGLFFGVTGLIAFDSGVLGYRSDSGYVKMIFSIGLLGLFFYAIHYLIFLFLSIKYLKYDRRFSYIIVLVLFLFIFQIKELGFGVVNFSFLIYITFFSLLYKHKYQKSQRITVEK